MRPTKRRVFFILLTALGLGWAVPTWSYEPNSAVSKGLAGSLVWNSNLAEATAKARQLHKLLLIDVYTNWCSWCKKLDRDTYSKANVQEYLHRKFVLLKEDAEDKGEGQALAEKYRIEGYPCILIMDVQGKQRGLIYGYRNAKDFPDAVDKAIEKSQK